MNEDATPITAFPEARARKRKERKTVWLMALFGTMICALVGGLAGAYMGYTGGSAAGMGPYVFGAAMLVGAVGSLVWSWQYWKSIDEMARRAHLDSLYWGGVIASTPLLILAGVIYVYDDFQLGFVNELVSSPTQAFGLGIATLYSSILLGYGVFWLVWWMRKR
jgi:hypothetical protein